MPLKSNIKRVMVIGSVTDGYNPQEEQFGNTRKLLEQLIGSDADILICTKSDLVVRDIDLLKKLGRVTVSWSINTLDENFKNDMDSAPYEMPEDDPAFDQEAKTTVFSWLNDYVDLADDKTFNALYICASTVRSETPSTSAISLFFMSCR